MFCRRRRHRRRHRRRDNRLVPVNSAVKKIQKLQYKVTYNLRSRVFPASSLAVFAGYSWK